MYQKLIYSYLRTESDNQYVLFLKVDSSIFEKEIDIDLTDSKQLSITFENGDKLITDTLQDDIYHSLANRNTVTIFANEDGDILGKTTFNPLKSKSSNI